MPACRGWSRSGPSPPGLSSRLRFLRSPNHEVDRAFDAIDAGQLGDAVDAANRARRLNPLSLGPLQAHALAADAAGDKAAAVAWYEKATELQPENPDAWYDLGLYQAIATHDQCAAYAALNHSYTLDPKSSRWVPGGPLDAAREAVNAGACESVRLSRRG